MKNLLVKLQNKMPSFLKNEKGATMVEYAIMVALIAIVSIVIITALGREVSTTFGVVNASLAAANTTAG